jgi:hypothetical protein
MSREQGERKSRGLKESDWREGLERRKARESAGGTTVRKIAEVITRRVCEEAMDFSYIFCPPRIDRVPALRGFP